MKNIKEFMKMTDTLKHPEILAILLLIDDLCTFKSGGLSLYDWSSFVEVNP